MSSKTQYLYLVKVSGMIGHYNGCKWQPDFVLYDANYRNNLLGMGMTIYQTEREAIKAILAEKSTLKKELTQYQNDLRILKKSKLLNRYDGLEQFIRTKTNYWCLIQKHMKFKVVKVELTKLRELMAGFGADTKSLTKV